MCKSPDIGLLRDRLKPGRSCICITELGHTRRAIDDYDQDLWALYQARLVVVALDHNEASDNDIAVVLTMGCSSRMPHHDRYNTLLH